MTVNNARIYYTHSPEEVARERWNVELSDDRAALEKLSSLQGKMPDVADLGNRWMEHQKNRTESGMKKAA